MNIAAICDKGQEQRFDIEDFVGGDFTDEEKERLFRVIEKENSKYKEEQRRYFCVIAGPILAELSPVERAAVFDFLESTTWGKEGKFKHNSWGSRSVTKVADAIIPLPEVIQLSDHAKEIYATEIAESGGDRDNFFRRLLGGFRKLKNPEQKERYLQALSRITPTTGFRGARETAASVLPELIAKFPWKLIEERYIRPLEDKLYNKYLHTEYLDRGTTVDIDADVAENLAESLEELLPLEENRVPRLREILNNHLEYHGKYLSDFRSLSRLGSEMGMLASGLPAVLRYAPNKVDDYIRMVRNIAKSVDCNLWNYDFEKALETVKEEDIDRLFDFASRCKQVGDEYSDSIFYVKFALGTGKKVYAHEGFSAFTVRRRLVENVPQDEDDIGSWILGEAEERLTKSGEEVAMRYVKSKKCLLRFHYNKLREVFKACNDMTEDDENYDFPELAGKVAELSIFVSMDSHGKIDALDLLKKLYRKDKIDCGNRAERFPQIIEELHRTKGDEMTKKFICLSPAFANAVLLGETGTTSGVRYGESFNSSWDKF